MTQGRRVGLSSAQKNEMWCRWKEGHSLHEIGRAFGKSHVSIHFLLSHHGGIVPAARRLIQKVLRSTDVPAFSGGYDYGLGINPPYSCEVFNGN